MCVCAVGYTRKVYGGHTTVPTTPAQDGYHGEEGYRKNTPELRRRRSVFEDEGKNKEHFAQKLIVEM